MLSMRADDRVEQPRLVGGDGVLVGPEPVEALLEEAVQPASRPAGAWSASGRRRGRRGCPGTPARTHSIASRTCSVRVAPGGSGTLTSFGQPLAVLGVEGPPAAHRPVAVHQQVQASALPTRRRAASAVATAPRTPPDLRVRGEERRRLRDGQRRARRAAGPPQVPVEPVVDDVEDRHLGDPVGGEYVGQRGVAARVGRRGDVHRGEAGLPQPLARRPASSSGAARACGCGRRTAGRTGPAPRAPSRCRGPPRGAPRTAGAGTRSAPSSYAPCARLFTRSMQENGRSPWGLVHGERPFSCITW